MQTLTRRFERMGFQVGISHQVFVKDLSRYTSLIVEGERKQGCATYRYMFYKITYEPHRHQRCEKVYIENASPSRVLQRVTSFLDWLEREVMED